VSKVVDLVYKDRCSGESKVNLVCGKGLLTENYAVERRDFRSWKDTRANLIGVCQKWSILYIEGQYSGVSKVNLGCGKVPVNRKLCSQETRKLYLKLAKTGFIFQMSFTSKLHGNKRKN
jgi:hypothetical protein